MKKLTGKYILIEEIKGILNLKTEGFNHAEIIGIITVIRDSKIIEVLNTKIITNENP